MKKRIAEMKNKEVEESKSLLRANEDRLKQILEVGGETVSGSQNIENIMTTLANNLSLHDLSLLFESNDNSLALDRINEAICM